MTEQVDVLKVRLKYAAIIAAIAAGLVIGGWLAPASWITVVTGLFAV